MVLWGPYQGFSKDTMAVRIAMPCLIVGSTGLRLYIRGRRGRKWDDALVSFGCFWLLVTTSTSIVVQVHSSDRIEDFHFALFTTGFTAAICVMWSARMSILQTIVQITPDLQDKKHRQMLTVGYVVLCLFEISQILWLCISKPEWDLAYHIPACACKKQIGAFHLISSTISDLPLVILPLVTIRSLKKSAPRIHTRLTLAFLAALCTTCLSIAGPLIPFIDLKIHVVYITLFEMYTALLVCNLPVLAAALWHLFRFNDISRQKSLPQMDFAAATMSAGNLTGIAPIGMQASSDNSLPPIHDTLSAPASATSRRGSIKFSSRVEASFVGRLKSLTASFADEEDECELEVRKIREGIRSGEKDHI